MSRTRLAVAAGAAGTLLLSLGATASAAPGQCDNKTVGKAIHQADQTAGKVPVVGPIAEDVIHQGVEPTACRLPV
jgi:hypothetical protein